MGLKCSMFGHSFGDPEVERDREEDGDEVVVTVREVKVCSRCGAESVVSENKEVTTLRQPGDEDGEDVAEASDDGEDTEESPEPDEPTVTASADDDDDAELLGEDEPVFDDTDDEDVVAAPPVDDADGSSETTAADDEDAAIIDAESGDPTTESDDDADPAEDPPVADPEDLLPDDATAGDESEAGEPMPPAEDAEPMPSGDAAETGAAQDRADAESDDGVILDEAEDPDLDPDRGHGEWPESDDVGPPAGDTDVEEWPADAGASGEGGTVTEAPRDAEAETEADAVDTGIASAGRAPSPDSATDDDRGAELFCPSCNYTASLERASLRVGDICPECKRGYLSER